MRLLFVTLLAMAGALPAPTAAPADSVGRTSVLAPNPLKKRIIQVPLFTSVSADEAYAWMNNGTVLGAEFRAYVAATNSTSTAAAANYLGTMPAGSLLFNLALQNHLTAARLTRAIFHEADWVIFEVDGSRNATCNYTHLPFGAAWAGYDDLLAIGVQYMVATTQYGPVAVRCETDDSCDAHPERCTYIGQTC